ncbi:MAG: STAS/SEC14 domain-containing protein [Opitutaceae bacterium]
MPISITREGELLVAKFQGCITTVEFLQSGREMNEIEQREPATPDRIIDLSETNGINLNFKTIDDFAQTRELSQLKNPAKSAIVAPGDLQFGLARMYQTMNRNPRLEVQVFRDQAAALAWLRPKV